MGEKTMPAQIPNEAIAAIRNVLLPNELNRSDSLELKISLTGEHVIVRDFVAFLYVLDRVYGGFTARTMRSYGYSSSPLQIEKIEAGSVDFSFVQSLRSLLDSHPIVAAFLVLNFLRLDKLSLTAKNLAQAFREFEEGLLVRQQRRDRQQVELHDDAFDPIARFLRELFRNDRTALRRARRFVKSQVRKINLEIKPK
jgi:hypothetical protein